MGCKAVGSMNDMPAFPCGRDVTLDQFAPSAGMTLRDYFAAKAMSDSYGQLSRLDQFKQCAKAAYEMADAMMEARK